MTSLDDQLAAAAVDAVMARLNREPAVASGASGEEYDEIVVPGADAYVSSLLAIATPPGDLAGAAEPVVQRGRDQAADTATRVAFAREHPEQAALVGLAGVSEERLGRLAAAAEATATAYAPAKVTAAVAEVVSLF